MNGSSIGKRLGRQRLHVFAFRFKGKCGNWMQAISRSLLGACAEACRLDRWCHRDLLTEMSPVFSIQFLLRTVYFSVQSSDGSQRLPWGEKPLAKLAIAIAVSPNFGTVKIQPGTLGT
jgi:hypothetical protein